MVKIEIKIKDENISHWGGNVIGGFVQDTITGEITGIKELSAPGFLLNGKAEGDDIYAELVEEEKFPEYIDKTGVVYILDKYVIDGDCVGCDLFNLNNDCDDVASSLCTDELNYGKVWRKK